MKYSDKMDKENFYRWFYEISLQEYDGDINWMDLDKYDNMQELWNTNSKNTFLQSMWR